MYPNNTCQATDEWFFLMYNLSTVCFDIFTNISPKNSDMIPLISNQPPKLVWLHGRSYCRSCGRQESDK